MTEPNNPFTAKVGGKTLREKVSIWTLDGLKNADIEIDAAIAKAYEQGKKESLLLRSSAEKASYERGKKESLLLRSSAEKALSKKTRIATLKRLESCVEIELIRLRNRYKSATLSNERVSLFGSILTTQKFINLIERQIKGATGK